MTIEIANRLVELRKKAGLSQEELATKLGLSRQAVSKWERAEASPDTDNLICLAKLYGVSLDDLLNSDQSLEEIASETKEHEEAKENKDTSRVFFGSCPEGKIEVTLEDLDDDGDDDWDEDGAEATINGERTSCIRLGNTVYVKSLKEAQRRRRIEKISGAVTGATVLIVTAVYVTCGMLLSDTIPHIWGSWWTLYMLVMIIPSIFGSFKNRKLADSTGAVVGLAVASYILLGFYVGAWGVAWPVFLAIPLWGIFASQIDDAFKDKRHQNDYKVEITR